MVQAEMERVVKPQMMVKVYPITNNCQLLFERREHVVLGISPFNSYFSVDNIAVLSSWAANHFKSFSLFIPDEPSAYTLMALGYDEVKAIKKAKRQANYLRNKCLKALVSLNLSRHEAEEIILDFRHLNQNANYLLALKFYKDKYDNDIEFRKKCRETSKWVLETQAEQISPDMLEIAVKYLLAEMPLFFNSAHILNKKEAVFCYRNCSSFIQAVFEANESILSHNQGYLVIDIESS